MTKKEAFQSHVSWDDFDTQTHDLRVAIGHVTRYLSLA